MTKLDEAVKSKNKEFLEIQAEKDNMKPYLDKQLWHIHNLENKENFYKDLKQKSIDKMNDMMELGGASSHTLKNGFTIKPDNRFKIRIVDMAKFLQWLKNNKNPQEVMSFLEDAIKLGELKKFCCKEFNKQQLNGEILPKICGIEFGELTYRKLITVHEKEKQNGKEKSSKKTK